MPPSTIQPLEADPALVKGFGDMNDLPLAESVAHVIPFVRCQLHISDVNDLRHFAIRSCVQARLPARSSTSCESSVQNVAKAQTISKRQDSHPPKRIELADHPILFGFAACRQKRPRNRSCPAVSNRQATQFGCGCIGFDFDRHPPDHARLAHRNRIQYRLVRPIVQCLIAYRNSTIRHLRIPQVPK